MRRFAKLNSFIRNWNRYHHFIIVCHILQNLLPWKLHAICIFTFDYRFLISGRFGVTIWCMKFYSNVRSRMHDVLAMFHGSFVENHSRFSVFRSEMHSLSIENSLFRANFVAAVLPYLEVAATLTRADVGRSWPRLRTEWNFFELFACSIMLKTNLRGDDTALSKGETEIRPRSLDHRN